jgi:peptidoglycan/xylan/chitin deacetylase (PgdA/CDA1 family)
MKIMKNIICVLLVLGFLNTHAQSGFKWPGGKKTAIILTYDDALISQLDHVVPQLAKYQLKGTFFLDGRVQPREFPRWKAAADAGNELANHSLHHPCSISAYKADYYSENYTVASMIDEIGEMNNLLDKINGKQARTYAYPCGKSVAGKEDYTEMLKASQLVKYARAGSDKKSTVVTDFAHLDFFKVPAWGLAAHTDGDALISLVKDAQKANGMAVFMFHGVGGDYIDVTAEAHEQLMCYLVANKADVWVGTFQEVLDYVKQQLNKNRTSK